MQRNDAYCFIRLGTFIERADNTARLLDVKSQLIEPAVDSLMPLDMPTESAPDFYAWSALLRSLSAFEAYHAVYRDALDSRRVTELLILRPDVPRSLRACCDEIREILPLIEARSGALDAGRQVKLLAGRLALRLAYGEVGRDPGHRRAPLADRLSGGIGPAQRRNPPGLSGGELSRGVNE